MPDINLGRVRIVPKGAWNSAADYDLLDLVTTAAGSFLALQPVPAGTPVTDAAFWQSIAANGTNGTNGTDGTNGTNGADGRTILNGAGAPSAGLGVNGDFYLNTATEELYGPKTAGAWGSPVSLIGPAGATGPAGLGVFPMKPAAGVYVTNSIVGGALGTVLQAAGRNTVAPFSPAFDMTIDQVAISVSTASAGTTAKVVIYASDANNRPTTVIAESADISCASTGTVTATLSASFEAGTLYWIGVRSSGAQTLRSLTAVALPVLSYTSAATPVAQGVLTKTETYANPAASWGYASSQHSNLTMPLVLMRVA